VKWSEWGLKENGSKNGSCIEQESLGFHEHLISEGMAITLSGVIIRQVALQRKKLRMSVVEDVGIRVVLTPYRAPMRMPMPNGSCGRSKRNVSIG
jgi:hypothetical protein